MSHLDGPEHVVVTLHGGVLARLSVNGRVHPGTLRALLRTVDLEPEQLDEYLSDPHGRRDAE